MSEPKTYYIEVKASRYTGDDLADYIENGPLYRDDEGTAEDATHEINRLRAAATYALTVMARLADSAHQWAGRDVPTGIVAEIDAAKARLAGVLEARP